MYATQTAFSQLLFGTITPIATGRAIQIHDLATPAVTLHTILQTAQPDPSLEAVFPPRYDVTTTDPATRVRLGLEVLCMDVYPIDL